VRNPAYGIDTASGACGSGDSIQRGNARLFVGDFRSHACTHFTGYGENPIYEWELARCAHTRSDALRRYVGGNRFGNRRQ
jgi:hypothetical protein